jgi:hypothetical protein
MGFEWFAQGKGHGIFELIMLISEKLKIFVWPKKSGGI